MRQAITAARPTSAPSMTQMMAFVIMFFVIVLVLPSQVFSDLRRCRNLHVTSIEHTHLPMVMGFDSLALDSDDAIDLGSDGPELAFLWCVLFHVFKIAEMR